MDYETADKFSQLTKQNDALRRQVEAMTVELHALRQRREPQPWADEPALGEWVGMRKAAEIAGCNRETVRQWLQKDPSLGRKVVGTWRAAEPNSRKGLTPGTPRLAGRQFEIDAIGLSLTGKPRDVAGRADILRQGGASKM